MKIGASIACLLVLACVSQALPSRESDGATVSTTTNATDSAQAALTSAQAFVQQFYDWYVPLALDDHKDLSAPDIVLTGRPSALDTELCRALRADSDAQAKAPGEIVGLDFDPFLNSQDPCERYVAGPASREGMVYEIPVRGICEGISHAQPDVITQVMFESGTWVFVNVHYPDSKNDLKAVLKELQRAREEPTR